MNKKLKTILLLCFSYLLYSCNSYAKGKVSESFYKIIEKEYSAETPYYDKGKVLISLIFYTIDNQNYVSMQVVPDYSGSRIKKWLELDNYFFIYYGINNALFNKYFCISEPDTAILSNYFDADNGSGVDWDVPAIIYHIRDKNNFEKYIPDEEHKQKLYDLFMEEGLILIPPPPPDEEE